MSLLKALPEKSKAEELWEESRRGLEDLMGRYQCYGRCGVEEGKDGKEVREGKIPFGGRRSGGGGSTTRGNRPRHQ